MTNIEDFFKSSIIESFNTTGLSILDIITTLSIALVLGLMVFIIYKHSFQGVVYSHNFNVTLLGMTLITALLIKTISSNILLSLGMVGALSIVRFRAAIKDPKDIMYLFFAISLGITVGAGLYSLAVISGIFIGFILFILSKFQATKRNYLLVLRYNNAVHQDVINILARMRHTVKARTISHNITELTVELQLPKKIDQTSITNVFASLDGVEHSTLVHYNGDYTE